MDLEKGHRDQGPPGQGMQGFFDFSPSFLKGPDSRGPGGGGGGGGGNKTYFQPPPNMRYGRADAKPKKVIEIPDLMSDVPIHKAENAWKPGSLKKGTEEITEEEKKTLELLKNFRGFLNKITPQMYDKILEKIKSLNIDTEDRLCRVLDLIFKKAVDEPAFCVQYANLCHHLASLSVTKLVPVKKPTAAVAAPDAPSDPSAPADEAAKATSAETPAADAPQSEAEPEFKEEEVKFQRLLLTKCQQEFERDIYENIDVAGKEKDINDCQDIDRKKTQKEELEELKRLARKKSLGNIK